MPWKTPEKPRKNSGNALENFGNSLEMTIYENSINLETGF